MATALETVVASVIMPDREGRFSISLRDGRIAEIEPERHDGSSRAWLALPGFANLHAHADRTFTVTSFRPRSFADALAASAKARAALLDLAEQAVLPVDLHIDEHLEPDRILAPMVVKAVEKRGLGSRVTFSHLCALATLDKSAAGALIDAIAKAGITVIALPETNLFLQDRSEATPRRRGVTLVRELLAAGVKVRFGTDNVRDWFFPFGDGDR